LAKELKIDVKELIQRLKDDLGLQEHFTYLSSLDEATVSRARQSLSAAATQMEELRVGENVKRRRRVASAPLTSPAPEPEPQVEAPPAPPPREEVKPRKAKEMARIVALPHKEKGSEKGAPPSEEVEPAAVAAAAAPRGPSQASLADSGTALKRQRGKARKKEVPARIISLPSEKPAPPSPLPSKEGPGDGVRPRTSAGRSSPGAAKPGTGITQPLPGALKPGLPEEKKEIKGKRKSRRPETPEAMRAKPLKKREVRERADLYNIAEGEVRGPRRRGLKKAIKKISKGELTVPKAIKRRIKVGESITVGELAKRMGIKSSEIIKQLLQMGVMASLNYAIDFESAVIVASEFGYEVEHATMQ